MAVALRTTVSEDQQLDQLLSSSSAFVPKDIYEEDSPPYQYFWPLEIKEKFNRARSIIITSDLLG